MNITEAPTLDQRMFYDSDGGTMHGMYFVLYKEPNHTKEDIEKGKKYIRNSQDSLGIKVEKLTPMVYKKAYNHMKRILTKYEQI